MSRARNCIATSLKASVGPWKSSSRKWFGADLDERRDGLVAERRVGLVDHAAERRRRRSRRR